MRKLIYKTISVLLLVFVVSCGKDKKTQTADPVPNKTEEVVEKNYNETEHKSTVTFEDSKITDIYNQYLRVKAALVNTNNKAAREAAKQLEAIIPEENKYKQLKATTKLFKLTRDIKKQRDFFVTITTEMEQFVTKAKVTSGEVYKQFCPMALDGNGGYWLSDSKEIRNPYYGSKMLVCGSVKATIQ